MLTFKERAQHLLDGFGDLRDVEPLRDAIAQAIEDAVEEATHNEKYCQDQSDTTTSPFEVIGGELKKVRANMEEIGKTVKQPNLK